MEPATAAGKENTAVRLSEEGAYACLYFIVDIDVTDPTAFEEYRKAVPATVEKYGGKFLVRGGRIEVVEGSWRPKRVVVTELPSLEQAKRWYDSEEYRALKALRLRTSKGNVILVEGV